MGEQASRFLAGASAALADLTDPDSTLQKLASLAVPQFADWCAVDMLDEKGERRRVAVAHYDPAKVRLAKEIEERYPARPDDPHGVARRAAHGRARTGRGHSRRDCWPRWPTTTNTSASCGSWGCGRTSACRSGRTGGRWAGSPSSSTGPAAATPPPTCRVAQDLAHRAAVAIENAALYRALREADRRKDEFLATLAHELRNPLAPIRNALQIMKMSDDSGSTWSRPAR